MRMSIGLPRHTNGTFTTQYSHVPACNHIATSHIIDLTVI